MKQIRSLLHRFASFYWARRMSWAIVSPDRRLIGAIANKFKFAGEAVRILSGLFGRPLGLFSGSLRRFGSGVPAMAHRIWVLAVAVVLTLGAGCSEESAGSTTTTSSSTSTTETTTTTSTTTSSTSTTIDPIAEAEAAVEAAYLRSYEVFVNCYRNLPDCDPATEFAEVYTDGLFDRVTAGCGTAPRLTGWSIEAPENPDHARTEILRRQCKPSSGIGSRRVVSARLAG